MVEERKKEDEFYEAMPGTMDQPRGRERDYVEDSDFEDYESSGVLPWVLVAVVVVLLGLLLLAGLSVPR